MISSAKKISFYIILLSQRMKKGINWTEFGTSASQVIEINQHFEGNTCFIWEENALSLLYV